MSKKLLQQFSRIIPLGDFALVLFIISLTSLLLELNIQGIVSSYFDVRIIIALFVIVLGLGIVSESNISFPAWKTMYLVFWTVLDLLLLGRFFALQAGRDLLVLAVIAFSLGLIFISLLVVFKDDTRRQN